MEKRKGKIVSYSEDGAGILKAIGDVCRSRRIRLKYSLMLASLESGISVTTIQRIENGRGGHAANYANYVRWLDGSLHVRFKQCKPQ